MEIVDHPETSRISVTTTDSGSRTRTTDRTKSDPEVADLLVLVLREAPDQRCGNAHPDRATYERLDTEPDDQPDVSERGLARIVLPAGIGDK